VPRSDTETLFLFVQEALCARETLSFWMCQSKPRRANMHVSTIRAFCCRHATETNVKGLLTVSPLRLIVKKAR